MGSVKKNKEKESPKETPINLVEFLILGASEESKKTKAAVSKLRIDRPKGAPNKLGNFLTWILVKQVARVQTWIIIIAPDMLRKEKERILEEALLKQMC